MKTDGTVPQREREREREREGKARRSSHLLSDLHIEPNALDTLNKHVNDLHAKGILHQTY